MKLLNPSYLIYTYCFVFCLLNPSYSQNSYPTQSGISVLNTAGNQLYFVTTSGIPSDTEPMPNGGFCVVTVDGNFTIYDDSSSVVFQKKVLRANDVDVIDENTFLFTSRDQKKIEVFQRLTGNSISLPSEFEGPVDTDTLPNGHLLICDAQGQRIVEMNPDGDIVWEFSNGLRQPMDAHRLNNGNTLISDFDNHRVIEVRADGEVVQSHHGFNHPQKIAPLNEYEFLIADSDNQRVIKLNLNGEMHVIKDRLNYVVSIAFYPSQNVYLCTVQNRFPPPARINKDESITSQVASSYLTKNMRLILFFIALGLGLLLWWDRTNAEWACIAFVAYYVILLGLGYWCVVGAASRSPYQPGMLFYAVVTVLAVSVFHDSRKTFRPIQFWHSSQTEFNLPFSFISICLLLVIPVAAMMAQYYHWVGFADGTKIPWYFTMMLWGVSVYILLRTSLITAKSEDQSPAIFTTGSVNEDTEAEYSSNRSSTILDSPEWRKLLQPSMIVILLISAGLYTIGATSIPYDVHGDEAEVALHGIEVRDSGNWNIFNPGWYLIPNLFFLIPAWGMWLFGDNVFGTRMAGALVGLATVPMFYLLARRILVPVPALMATFLFSVAAVVVHFSRLGVGYNQATLFTVTVLYCLLHGVQLQNARSISLAGLIAGLGLLSYQATKILVPLSVVSIFVLMVIQVIQSQNRYSACKNGLKYFLLFGLGVWISLAPLFGSFLKDPGAFSSRTKSVSVFHEDGRRLMRYNFPNTMTIQDIVVEQFWRTTVAPVSYPDLSPYLSNQKNGGMMDPLPAVFFSAGIIILAGSISNPSALILLVWYICLLYPTVITNSAPAYQRLVCLLPILYIIAAPVLAAIVSQASTRLRHIPSMKTILVIGVSFVVLLVGMHRYFHQIMSIPQQLNDHTRVAYHLRETGPTVFTYMFGRSRFSIEYGTIRLIAPDTQGMDVTDPDQFFKTPVSKQGPLQFLFLGRDLKYAGIVKELYPGGKLETHLNRLNQSPFITYQVNL